MVDAHAPAILLGSKAEVHAQPISPFPSRFCRRLRAALRGDDGNSSSVHCIDAVVHRPHLAPALHDCGGKEQAQFFPDQGLNQTCEIQALTLEET